MSEKRYFPLFLDLSEKRVVVAGAGTIALRRVNSLLGFAGRIEVIAKEFKEEFYFLAEGCEENFGTRLTLREKSFEPQDVEGADLVLCATDDAALNAQIVSLCRERKIPVNTSHDKTLCDFYFPGVVAKGPVVIGVSASGKDHALARVVTERIRRLAEEEESF